MYSKKRIYNRRKHFMSNVKPVPGTNGNQYIPYDQRTGEESVVYFTRDLSAAGLKKIYYRQDRHKAAHRRKEWPKHHSSSMGKRTDGR